MPPDKLSTDRYASAPGNVPCAFDVLSLTSPIMAIITLLVGYGFTADALAELTTRMA